MASVSVVSGDTVLVWPGSLPGGYVLRTDVKSGVVLMAQGYPDSVVVIQGAAGVEPALRLIGTSELTEVVGFHITWDSGLTLGQGGGISGFVASGTIRDNVFLDCVAGAGAGVYMQASSLIVENNLFVNNRCGAGAGVIAASGGTPIIRNNTFAGSVAPFGLEGSVMYGIGSDFTFENNIVYGSQGAAAVYCGGGNNPIVGCNLFYNNELGAFSGQCPDSTGASGNSVANPLFCNPPTLNYGLCVDSPALARPACGPIGYTSPFGNCAACQPTSASASVQNLSWGRVKGTYR
jgi:hypothetical protein